MSFTEAIKSCFSKSLTFSGSASRYDFWNIVLFLLLTLVLLVFVNSALFGPTIETVLQLRADSTGRQQLRLVRETNYDAGLLGAGFLVITALPLLAAAWRRMQDIGRSVWYLLLPLPAMLVAYAVFYATARTVTIDPEQLPSGVEVPESLRIPDTSLAALSPWLVFAACAVVVLFWLFRASQDGSNRFGPNPAIEEMRV
ncbi:DUF805 domain-containing protein [Lutimaribacter marinistellae]|uniref:DUF805 domain-containing protein n=1 Tax=Lutimaribacter marinistellae TaxID=1820329 RepID=A0ABV7TDG8_9RHOB